MRTYDLPSGLLVNLSLKTDGIREGHLDVEMSLVVHMVMLSAWQEELE